MKKRVFKNLVTTSPSDVEDGDAFAIKIVAVAGRDEDWAAYMGPSDWTDEEIAQAGNKLLEKQAEPLFYVLRTLRRYRR